MILIHMLKVIIGKLYNLIYKFVNSSFVGSIKVLENIQSPAIVHANEK